MQQQGTARGCFWELQKKVIVTKISKIASCVDPYVDARFWFSSFYNQDLGSINSITTRRSPREAFFLQSFLHTQASQRAPVIPRRKPSDAQVRYEGSGNVCPKILWLFRGFLFFSFYSLSNLRKCQPFYLRWLPFYRLPSFPLFPSRYGTLTVALWANVGPCVLRHGSEESVMVAVL